MLDRLSLLLPRLAHAKPSEELALADALIDLRIGVAIVELRHVRGSADKPTRQHIDAMLVRLNEHFREMSEGRKAALLDDVVRNLDDVINGLLRVEAQTERTIGLGAAVALLRNLFPKAAPYREMIGSQ